MARGGTGKSEGRVAVGLRRVRCRRSGIFHREAERGGRGCEVLEGERVGLCLVLKVAMVRMRIH